MDKVIVALVMVAVIGLVFWWFFGKRKTDAVPATKQGGKQTVEITVDGGYKPAVVELQQGTPADLVFIRKDASACFEEVVIPDFGIKTKLPVNKPYTVSITPKQAGEYQYACGMNMFFGKVVVK